MAETLGRKDSRFILLCILICAASLWIGIRYFYRAFPEASIEFKVNRDSSRPLAEKFLAAQGKSVRDFRHAASFRYDDDTKVFLERELGLERANALMGKEVKLWRWGHRFFKPSQKEEIRIEITTRGEVASFSHILPEDAAGADLPADAARALAESFLVLEMRHPVDSFEFVDSQTQKRPNRTDHVFTWKVAGMDLRNASYRVEVTLQGDRVDGYREYVKIPEEWSRSYRRLRSLNETATEVDLLFFALLGIGMLVVLGQRIRLKDIRWKTALAFGLIALVLQLLASLNDFPLEEYGFDTTSSYGSFVSRYLILAALGALSAGGVIFLLTACVEPLYRQSYRFHLSISRMISWHTIRTRSFFIAALAGITLTFFFFAYEIGFYLLAKWLGAWAPADIPYTDLLNTRFPWIFVLLGGFFPAVSEEWAFRAFSIPFLQRLLRYRWIAIVVSSFVWGFGHANYPNQPFFIRGIEVGIVGLILSWAMLRFGILAPLIAHYSIDAFYSAFLFLRSGNAYLVTTGAVTAGIYLIPILLAAGAYLVKREFRSETAVTNESEAVAPPEPPAMEVPSDQKPGVVYSPLKARTKLLALVLLVIGILLTIWRAPHFGDSVQFRLRASEAALAAKKFLSSLKFSSLDDFRQVTQPYGRVDPIAAQYICAAAGIERLNAVYGRHIRPVAWQTRFYRPLQKEEFQVNVDPVAGKLISFRHLLPEEAQGADLPEREARQIAESFLRSQEYDLTRYGLKETKSEKPKQRRDTEFTWEARAGTEEAVGEARLRLQVEVLGDQIGTWTQSLKIPEEWRRARERQNFYSIASAGIRVVFLIMMFSLALLSLVQGIRQGRVRWRFVAAIAAAAMVLELIHRINAIPQLWSLYDTQLEMRIFILTGLVGGILLLIGIGLSVGLAAGLIMACYPDASSIFHKSNRILWGRDALITAVATVGAFMTLQGIASRIQYHAGRLVLAPAITMPENIGTYLPLVSSVRDAALSGLFLSALIAFAIRLWSRLAGRTWLRALLLAGLLGSFLPTNARRLSEVALDMAPTLVLIAIACALVAKFCRDNYLAYFLSAAFLVVERIAMSYLRQGNAALVLQGAILILLALGAAAFLWFRPARATAAAR